MKIKKFIVLLMMIAPLVGCVPAVIVAGAAGATLGGAIIYDKRNYQTMKEDHIAHAIAQQRLDNDPFLMGHSHITVAVFNNVALLVGQAQTPEVRQRAYEIVSKVPHIKRVYNQIQISTPVSATKRAKDAWITTKIRSVMLGKRGFNSSNLKVVTENGVVYLMGVMTRKQAAQATNVARRVAGVRQVVKVFEYE